MMHRSADDAMTVVTSSSHTQAVSTFKCSMARDGAGVAADADALKSDTEESATS